MKSKLVLVPFLFSLTGFAGNYAGLGSPEIKGNGCNDNSVNVTLSPDNSALTLLFDRFSAEASGNRKQDRKNCRIIVPIDLQADETISIIQMDFRGFTALPKNGVSDLTVDTYVGQRSGRPTQARFKGEVEKDFVVTDKVEQFKKAWTPCGRPLRLHIQAGIDVRSNQKGEQAMIGIDSLDVASGIVYKLERKKCQRQKDERWDNPIKRRLEDMKERAEEKARDERFDKRPWKEILENLRNHR